jgi:hypothetical protein
MMQSKLFSLLPLSLGFPADLRARTIRERIVRLWNSSQLEGRIAAPPRRERSARRYRWRKAAILLDLCDSPVASSAHERAESA